MIIPDNSAAGANIPLTVAGVGSITDLDFRFDTNGACDATLNNLNCAVNHTWVGDLVYKLTSPGGTTVTFIDRIGVPASTFGNSGNNFGLARIDDDGGFSPIEGFAGEPVAGNFAPNNPLSAFDGQNANGAWTLNVSDLGNGDTGSVQRFSLVFSSASCVAPTPTPSPSPSPSPTPCATPSNTTAIAIPNSGAAAPYPSTIPISGLGGTVTKLTVKLNNLSHTFPDDIDVMLVGPGGQNAIIMSDVGGSTAASGITLTLDDGAAASLPDSGGLSSGTFRPTNFETGDPFPSPAPAPTGGSPLSVFNGTAPNGNWSLYVVDDTGGDLGSFAGGWQLSVTTTSCAPPTPTPTPVPQISINSITRNEGNAGTTLFSFDLTINRIPSPGSPASTVNFATVDGTATVADADFTANSGVISFDSNSPALQKVNVLVNSDTKFEPNEAFLVKLSGETNATLPEREGTGIVFNDDVEPTFSVNDVSGNEGNSGTTPFTFAITRSGNATAFSSVVTYSTANGTATSPDDYAATNASVTFAPNEVTKNVTVLVNGDTTVEPNETFTLNITSASNGTIARATGTGTILNDDGVSQRVEGDVVDGSGGPGGDNQVLANDVNVIRQIQLGLLPAPAPGPQFQAADVNLDAPGACGNGQIDAGDVTVIRGYNLGVLNGLPLPTKPVCGPTAPVVTGPDSPEVVGRIIRAVNTTGTPGQPVTVSYQLDSQGDEASFSFTTNWNPAVLTYVSSALGSGVPAGANLGLNTSQAANGRLGVLVDSTNTFAAGTRQILTVTFVVAANAAPGVYPITFSGSPTAQSVSSAQGALLTTVYESGNVTILATAAGVTVSGRITNPNGQGVRGASVVITSSTGNRRTVTTSSFGTYTFNDVEAGGSYVIGVTAKRYRFASRVVNVTDSLTDINLVGQE